MRDCKQSFTALHSKFKRILLFKYQMERPGDNEWMEYDHMDNSWMKVNRVPPDLYYWLISNLRTQRSWERKIKTNTQKVLIIRRCGFGSYDPLLWAVRIHCLLREYEHGKFDCRELDLIPDPDIQSFDEVVEKAKEL